MKKSLVVSAAVIGLLFGASMAMAHDEEHGGSWKIRLVDSKDPKRTAPATNALYKSECASCHIAYPPGLLPEDSWVRVIGNLENHFGENVELPAQKREELLRYLAPKDGSKPPVVADKNQPLPRISDTRAFRGDHHEIPRRMVAGNPQVKSYANCQACHAKAEQGHFDEDEVTIPGFGRWED